MEFNSQICTTKIQSERLLALRLKKETADCIITQKVDGTFDVFNINCGLLKVETIKRASKLFVSLPSWSLHRLIEMMPTLVNPIRNLFVSNRSIEYRMSEGRTTHVFANENNIYDNVINCIEWLISVGEFNKEYLEE